MSEFMSSMLTVLIDSAIMPTGKNLVSTIFFGCVITVLNIVFRIMGWKVGVSWQGCLLALLVLFIILIIERSEYSAVSKMYRDVELRLKDIKVRQQTASSGRKDDGTTGVRKERRSTVHRRTNNRHTDKVDVDGPDVSNNGGEEPIDWYDESN